MRAMPLASQFGSASSSPLFGKAATDARQMSTEIKTMTTWRAATLPIEPARGGRLMQILTFATSGAAALAAAWIVDQGRREFISLKNDASELAHDLEVAGGVFERVPDRVHFAES